MSPPATHAVQLLVLTVAFIAAAVGIVALPEDMLPINQVLLVIDFAHVTTWLLVLVTRREGDGRDVGATIGWIAIAGSWVIDTMTRPSLESVSPGQRMYVISMVGRTMHARGAELPAGWERALSLLCGWGDPADAAHEMIDTEVAVRTEATETEGHA